MPASDIADTVMLAQSGADMLMLSDRDALGRVIVASRPASASTLSSVKQVSQVCVAAECMLEGHSNSEPVSPRITSKPLTDVEALLHGAAAAAVDCSAGELPVGHSAISQHFLMQYAVCIMVACNAESRHFPQATMVGIVLCMVAPADWCNQTRRHSQGTQRSLDHS